MIRLLFFLIWGGCDHKWRTVKEIPVVGKKNYRVATEYHQICNKCGHLKKRTIW